MTIKKWSLVFAGCIFLHLSLLSPMAYAGPGNDGVGQYIQIHTHLTSITGNPSWLLIIRDVDNNQNIPYLFDFTRENNVWVAFSFSKNYLITVSNLQTSLYKSRSNNYKNYRINNFCHLETGGRIIRGQSIRIDIEGELTPRGDKIECQISRFDNPNFTIVSEESGESSN